MKSNSSSKQVSRGVISLFSSNIIAFLITGLSYFVYSKSLLPSEFGLYSIALAIASFGTLALDGGLKNTIIKSPNNLSKDEEGTLHCHSNEGVAQRNGMLHHPIELDRHDEQHGHQAAEGIDAW